jgi:hypothetical protein
MTPEFTSVTSARNIRKSGIMLNEQHCPSSVIMLVNIFEQFLSCPSKEHLGKNANTEHGSFALDTHFKCTMGQ